MVVYNSMEELTRYAYSLFEVIRTEPILSGLAVLIIYFFIRQTILARRITRLTSGGDGKTLEGTIKKLDERTAKLEEHAQKVELALENIDGRLQTSIRGVSVERFDPFRGAGGQQSFSTALINEEGNGVVLSGIHSRDSVRVYAKEIRAFASERELSKEEEEAVRKARTELS